ncbi:lysylphosphatidylglycerol synthase transmembrane domain-containing protein [Cohnella sp. CFH 77786]|uniref:lysylphosphatidylglycerol synthase transmembrane domain-containing protein n=1 Tax=Cohnella sp. CFH 77786 TaxID=2662265 RepID=UPI001C60CFF5|nr:lysylphosphatidylglycerol synthase transmembrane domain-containing protein [Cohnella sp. CFH 77786]
MVSIAKILRGAVGVAMLAVFAWLAGRYLQVRELSAAFSSLLRSPGILVIMTIAYAASFLLKSAAWKLYANARQSAWKHVAPLGYSLFINHLLPIKAGDLVRTGLAAKLERQNWDEALHTVAVMRVMDISVLLLFGGIGLAVLGVDWVPGGGFFIAGAAVLGLILLLAGLRFANQRGIRFAERQLLLLRRLRTRRAFQAWLITAASWVFEAVVPFGVLIALKTQIPFGEAVWVNSMTVAGQLFHVTPGGIGTYETTMSASLAALGEERSAALTAAVVSHAYKFLFAFAAGAVSWLILPIGTRDITRWLRSRRTGKEEPAQ